VLELAKLTFVRWNVSASRFHATTSRALGLTWVETPMTSNDLMLFSVELMRSGVSGAVPEVLSCFQHT
jgi:hypothetical protein